jgi:hypothetical protein
MKQGPFREADSRSVIQEIHYRIYKTRYLSGVG